MDIESYIDLNIFAYWLCNYPIFGRKAYKWIKKIEESPKGKYVTSSLTLYQTLMIIASLTGKNLKDEELVKEIVHSITCLPGLAIALLTAKDLTEEISLMEKYKLDYEDALHLAVVLRNKQKK